MNKQLLIGLSLGFACCANLAAAPISDIFNTGVDGTGTQLSPGANDPHYDIVVDPSGAGDQTVPSLPGAWIANPSDARWIGPDTDTSSRAPGGANYTYQTTFSLPAMADLSTVSVMGSWATDNGGVDIVLNGFSVGSGQLSPDFTALTDFTITTNFQAGTNTLQFVVNNAPSGTRPNPTGLLVSGIQGTYELKDTPPTPNPEPATLALLGIGIAGAAGIGRRRSRKRTG
jgi:hypothetical protein